MIDQKTLFTFDELYNNSYDYILKYVICNCSKIEDVDDIMQNIYIEMYKIISKNIKIDNYKTYILGIAKNKVKDYYRFNYRLKIFSIFSIDEKEEYENIPSKTDIEKEIMTKDNMDNIWKYLKTKKIIIFKIFYLYYYKNMTIKGISKELNITESNVKHHLYRTLKELKDIFGGE